MILAHVTPGASPWKFHAHPEVWLIVTGALVGYVALITRVGPAEVADGQPVVTRKQVALFVSGIMLLWIGADYPVHDLAENYLYSVHMVQHMMFTLIVPPLLILGTPQWMQRWMLRPPALERFVKWACRPLMAMLLFNAMAVVSHVPQFVNYTSEHELAHFLGHNLLFWTAMIMWFPVLNQMPDYPRMSAPLKIGYLFVQSIIPNVPVAFLAFADGVVYKHYATVPHPFGLSVVEDQQLAGGIMKTFGTLILWTVILVVFAHWYRDEHAEDVKHQRRRPVVASNARSASGASGAASNGTAEGAADEIPEVLTWDHVERELSRTKPASGP